MIICAKLLFVFFFFFSSRRRHTRSKRDWSSDVCSSDLELLTRETILPKWRELLITLRRLEDRGELRGGRFVSNFLGEQFALPVAVESLRAMRNQQPCGEIIAISAADPLNLVGIIVPGERVAANSGSVVSYRDGVALERNESANVISMPIAR